MFTGLFQSPLPSVKAYVPSRWTIGLATCAVGLSAYRLWRLKNALSRTNPEFPQGHVEKDAQWISEDLVAALDEKIEDIDDLLERVDPAVDSSPTECKFGGTSKLVAALATLIKLEVGKIEPTEANRMVVERMVVKVMRARFMRQNEQIRLLPFVVSMVFVPTIHDVRDREMRYAEKTRARIIRNSRVIKLAQSWTEWFWGCSANRGALEFRKN